MMELKHQVDLVALRRPVRHQFPVVCEPSVRGVCADCSAEPHDRWFQIVPFRGPGKALLRQWEQDPGNAALLMELLHMAVPSATDTDFDALSLDEDVPRVIAAADGKAALVEFALKNGNSGGVLVAPSPSTGSSPMTKSRTSSGASLKRTSDRGKKSTKTSGTSRSSASTR